MKALKIASPIIGALAAMAAVAVTILASFGALWVFPGLEPTIVALPLVVTAMVAAYAAGDRAGSVGFQAALAVAKEAGRSWTGEIDAHNRTMVKLEEAEAARRRQAERIRYLEADVSRLRNQLRAAQDERDELLGMAELSGTQRDFWKQHAQDLQDSVAARTDALAGLLEVQP